MPHGTELTQQGSYSILTLLMAKADTFDFSTLLG